MDEKRSDFPQICHQILVSIENTDDLDPLPFQNENYQMSPVRMNAYRRREL